jgi:drug/metabolite transporter (DMT)-like permease
MPSYRQSLAVLHSAVLLFALSGLFAKWLALAPSVIVFGRAFFAALSLAAFILLFKKQSLLVPRNILLAMAITGAVLAFHWLTFFKAIQLSNVAIGLITFATFPIFVSFLEPLFFKEKLRLLTIVQALLTVLGIMFVLPPGSFNTSTMMGALFGVCSALSFAVLTLLNRKYVRKISAKTVAFYQNSFACLVLLPTFYLLEIDITLQQLSLLILLGVVFTALAHTLFNHALKRLNAAAASIAVSLEPIYGIIAAFILLDEPLTILMVVGGAIVIATNIWAARATP